mgnify:CR=1 FL=1
MHSCSDTGATLKCELAKQGQADISSDKPNISDDNLCSFSSFEQFTHFHKYITNYFWPHDQLVRRVGAREAPALVRTLDGGAAVGVALGEQRCEPDGDGEQRVEHQEEEAAGLLGFLEYRMRADSRADCRWAANLFCRGDRFS